MIEYNENDAIRIALRAVQMHEARHPRPTHVNLIQAAEMLDVHPQTMRKILKHHGVIPNACGRYPIEVIDRLRAPDDRVRVVSEKGDTIINEVPIYVPVQADAACAITRGLEREN